MLFAAAAIGFLTGGLSLQAQASLYSRDQIDQMVAPIALYPDALMSQVFMAATFPEQVTEADQWVRANPGLTGQQLDDALATATWDPSIIALCKFPTVLDRMAGNIKWTTDLGNAFLNQKADVMDAVQTLRRAAYQDGHLRTTSQQRVVFQDQAIVIQPYNPEVVYVPVYQPAVVYGPVWSYPTYYYPSVWDYSPGASFVNGFFWGLGFRVGNILFGGCDWYHHDVYVNNTVIVRNSIFHNSPYYRHGYWRRGGYGRHAWHRHVERSAYVRGGGAPYGGRSHGRIRGIHTAPVRSHIAFNRRAGARGRAGSPDHRYRRNAPHGPTGRYALHNGRARTPIASSRRGGRYTRATPHGPTGRYALRNSRTAGNSSRGYANRNYHRRAAHGPTGRYAHRNIRTPRRGFARNSNRSYGRRPSQGPTGYRSQGHPVYRAPRGNAGRYRSPSVHYRSFGRPNSRANRGGGHSYANHAGRGGFRSAGRSPSAHRGGGGHRRRR